MDKKVAEATGEEFRLALPLVQRLQRLREACKPKNKGDKAISFAVTLLNRLGLTATIKSSSLAAIVELDRTLPTSDLFTLEPNPDGKTLQLSYAPSDSTATLTFTTDLGAALQTLANSASLSSGEQLFARPTFIAPNGGHHVFSTLASPPEVAEDQVVMATAEQLREASAGAPIELESDVVFPPVHAFGFGPLTVSIGRTSMRTSVELRGPAKEWAGVKLSITCKVDGEQINGGVREGNQVAECWYLEKWKYDKKNKPVSVAKHRWKKTLEFTVEATHTKGMANPPAPITDSFDATPKLLKVEATRVGDKVVITGDAHAMPTSAALAVNCKRKLPDGRWIDAIAVNDSITHRRDSATGPNSLGAVDEYGKFRAEADAEAFALEEYHFTLYVSHFSSHESHTDEAMVMKTPYEFDIAPVSHGYSGADLGATAPPKPDDHPATTGEVNEGLHGAD
jgi:hypothetical protein